MIQLEERKERRSSGVTWIGDIPAHWKIARIKAVSALRNLRQSNLPDGAIYIGLEDVESGSGCYLPTAGSSRKSDDSAVSIFNDRDVLYGKLRPYLRKAIVADAEGACSTEFLVLDAESKGLVKPEWIHGWLLTHDVTQRIEAGCDGAKMPRASWEHVSSIPIPVPSLEEQNEILVALARKTARIDTLIAKKTRFIELLKEKRQAVITKAVTKGLDDSVEMRDLGFEWLSEVPAHWEIRRMASIFREAVRPGDPSLPILSISIHDGITDGELAAEDRDRRVTQIEDRSKYKRVKPNDIAYNMMRAWQGAFGAVAVEGLVSPAYVVAEPTQDLHTGYIEQLLRTPMAVEEMRRYSRGIADFRMRLYWEYFRDLKVCLPPVVEQKAILERIDRETTRIDLLVTKTERSIELLKEHRTAMITAAVTGKIDVREAA